MLISEIKRLKMKNLRLKIWKKKILKLDTYWRITQLLKDKYLKRMLLKRAKPVPYLSQKLQAQI